MCGIFAVLTSSGYKAGPNHYWKTIKSLFIGSSRRGQDCSGLYFYNGIDELHTVNDSHPRSILNQRNKGLVKTHIKSGDYAITIGQTRMITNGNSDHDNIQPLLGKKTVLSHNGIITNEEEIKNETKVKTSTDEVDTKTALQILENHSGDINQLKSEFNKFEGANNFIFFNKKNNKCILNTSHGSLYFVTLDKGLKIVASERRILEKVIKAYPNCSKNITQCQPNVLYCIDLKDGKMDALTINKSPEKIIRACHVKSYERHYLTKYVDDISERINTIKRCSKCLLPETVPFIQFDPTGTCNYCQNFGVASLSNKYDLKDLEKRLCGQQKIIFPLSGGRDSCFGLNFLSQYKDLEIVAYTYDWGMVTDLARRNISRVCGTLEVEHILISADIKKKLSHIKKNINAWLKQPHLGTVPLFMAGDKQFFYYMNKVQKEIGADEIVGCFNPYERTDFKTGFCGVDPFKIKNDIFFGLDYKSQIIQLGFYGKQFLTNPKFINSSLFDTAWAYLSYYVIPKTFLTLFDYIPWSEDIVENTIIKTFGWELANDTSSSWRIGDGTAPFYNYIYITLAGFTENDALRSNQIRTGQLSRDQAFARLKEDNKHRLESLEWYFNRLDLNPVDIINKIKQS
ncbi:hypothetical protein N9I70_00265 [Alphaproteobacteria bacterium]|nr:hypothetical protein [Alphaproteobacteria bacterium]